MIDQPTYELSKVAVEFLLERINGLAVEPRTHYLRTKMLIRGST
jgi:DNA-binding LacI/PurR family transcriptional regulator